MQLWPVNCPGYTDCDAVAGGGGGAVERGDGAAATGPPAAQQTLPAQVGMKQ